MSTIPDGDKLYRTCVNFKALSLMSSLGATTVFGGDLFLAGSPLMTWGPLSRVKEANDALQDQRKKIRTMTCNILDNVRCSLEHLHVTNINIL